MAAHYDVHLWNIYDDSMLDKIMNCKTGQKFMSDAFTICNLICKLVIFPNGKTLTDSGSLILFLSVLKVPNEWKYITFNWSLKCLETMCQVNGISSLTNNGNKNKNIRWSNRLLLLNELQQMHSLKTITFEVTINIIEIKQNDSKHLYHFYNYDNINDLQREYKLSWHINEEMMDKFNNQMSCYYGKRFSEPISIANMWSIACFPYGFNEKWNGFMSLSLQLNYLPANVSKIKIKFRFKCLDIEYDKTRIKTYSLQDQHRGIVDFCESKYIKHLDTMDFEAYIKILNIYDLNGNEIGIKQEHCTHNKSDKDKSDKCAKSDKSDKSETIISALDIDDILSMKAALNEQKKQMKQELLKLQQLRIELEMERKELILRKQQQLQYDDEKQYDDCDGNESFDKAMECTVKSWLKHTVRLSEYVDNFLFNGFDDINVIQQTMNIEDLSQIGIKKLGHRKKIMLYIDKLKSHNDDAAAAADDPHMF